MVWLACTFMMSGPPIGEPSKLIPADRWIVELETVPPLKQGKSDLGGAHAPSVHQILWRQKPGETGKTKLFEQTNVASLKMIHRGDGLILLWNPIGTATTVYFPTSDTAVPVKWSLEATWERNSGLTLDIDKVRILGDCLLTTRSIPNGGGHIVEMARFDETKRTIETKTITHTVDRRFDIGGAGTIHRDAFRMGDLILWTNYGLHDGSDEPKPQNDWGHRKLRVLDVANKKLIDTTKLTDEQIKPHLVAIRMYLETKAHNTIPEFEIWAVEKLAKHGDAADAASLRSLSKSIKETDIQIKYGHYSSSVPAVTKAYQDAFKTLAARGQ